MPGISTCHIPLSGLDIQVGILRMKLNLALRLDLEDAVCPELVQWPLSRGQRSCPNDNLSPRGRSAIPTSSPPPLPSCPPPSSVLYSGFHWNLNTRFHLNKWCSLNNWEVLIVSNSVVTFEDKKIFSESWTNASYRAVSYFFPTGEGGYSMSIQPLALAKGRHLMENKLCNMQAREIKGEDRMTPITDIRDVWDPMRTKYPAENRK